MVDAGVVDAGVPLPPGPWPVAAVVNFTALYDAGTPQSFGIDEAQNVWLLNGNAVGVLRGGDRTPHWAMGLGQAAPGFGADKLALFSTVICGGTANQAYVGYAANELTADLNAGLAGSTFIFSPDGLIWPEYDAGTPANYDPVRHLEYQRGDADMVTSDISGNPTLVEHLNRSLRGPLGLGLHNTNDYHFMEDRTIFSCTRVTRGPLKGDVYLGTNHGVTRVQGLNYNSHRHIVWESDGHEHIGENHGLGVAPNGDILIANEWMFGIVTPSAPLENWDKIDNALNLAKVSAFLPQLNDVATFDHWRGFQQTSAGAYYLASAQYGLWAMTILDSGHASGSKIAGLPTDALTSIAATNDGSLFIGTDGFGTWRLSSQGTLTSVASAVPGSHVRGMFYEPGVAPAMLFVLTDQGLVALRGY